MIGSNVASACLVLQREREKERKYLFLLFLFYRTTRFLLRFLLNLFLLFSLFIFLRSPRGASRLSGSRLSMTFDLIGSVTRPHLQHTHAQPHVNLQMSARGVAGSEQLYPRASWQRARICQTQTDAGVIVPLGRRGRASFSLAPKRGSEISYSNILYSTPTKNKLESTLSQRSIILYAMEVFREIWNKSHTSDALRDTLKLSYPPLFSPNSCLTTCLSLKRSIVREKKSDFTNRQPPTTDNCLETRYTMYDSNDDVTAFATTLNTKYKYGSRGNTVRRTTTRRVSA